MKKHTALLFLALVLVASCFIRPFQANAEDEQPVEIYTFEDLLQIADNPSGSYRLMADIDMNGRSWPAITFSGIFDGNGHILLNANNIAVSAETRVTYDGNRKTYDTHFGGLFAILEKAVVKNVRLININMNVDYQGDCFLGGIAGYASESTIENCEIVGTIRLDVTGKMFGVGGIVGFGNGKIHNCKGEVTLINIDKDKDSKDEQFLGGICACGYTDLEGCEMNLSGFISDHGYVHSGGLMGMYIVYPTRFQRNGYLKNNTLEGFITFFEDNRDRRAYCEQRCGEIMDWVFSESGNRYHFTRDERKTYSVNLLPHGDCGNPDFVDTVIPADCTNPGYVYHLCKTCGYYYRDSYTNTVHTPGDTFETVKEPSLTEEGIAEYICTVCGTKLRSAVPTLTPSPTPTMAPTPSPEPTSAPTPVIDFTKLEPKPKRKPPFIPIAIVIAVLLCVGVFVYAVSGNRKK